MTPEISQHSEHVSRTRPCYPSYTVKVFPWYSPKYIFTYICNNPEEWGRLQNQKYNYPIIPFHSSGRGEWFGVWAILSSSEERSQSCLSTHILNTEQKSRPRWAFCNWEFLKKCQFIKASPISMKFGLGKVFQVHLEDEQPSASILKMGDFTWGFFFTAIFKFVCLCE